MAVMSKARKEELSFFLNDQGRIEYCSLCSKCEKECKQSYKIKAIYCPVYKSKRAVT